MRVIRANGEKEPRMPAEMGRMTRAGRVVGPTWRAAILRAAVNVALVVTLLASVGAGSACGAQSRQSTPAGAASVGQFDAGELGIFLSARAASQNTSGPQANAGRLYALRASDGAHVWSAATDGLVFELAAADGMLYVSLVTQDSGS